MPSIDVYVYGVQGNSTFYHYGPVTYTWSGTKKISDCLLYLMGEIDPNGNEYFEYSSSSTGRIAGTLWVNSSFDYVDIFEFTTTAFDYGGDTQSKIRFRFGFDEFWANESSVSNNIPSTASKLYIRYTVEDFRTHLF